MEEFGYAGKTPRQYEMRRHDIVCHLILSLENAWHLVAYSIRGWGYGDITSTSHIKCQIDVDHVQVGTPLL